MYSLVYAFAQSIHTGPSSPKGLPADILQTHTSSLFVSPGLLGVLHLLHFVSGFIQSLTFQDRPLLHAIVLLQFIHIVLFINNPVLYSDGSFHLGCLKCFSVLSDAAMNLVYQILCDHSFL